MALFTVTSGNVAQAGDLNQIVNALNGTDTTTQITVANRIRAQMTGAATASGYVGGVNGAAPTSGTFVAGDMVVDQKGMVWICTSAGTPGTWVPAAPAARFHADVSQSIAQNVTSGGFGNIVTYDVVESDPNSDWSSNAYFIPVTGRYRVSAAFRWAGGGFSTTESTLMVFKNGSEHRRLNDQANTPWSHTGSAVARCTVGDFLDIRIFQNSGSTQGSLNSGVYTYAQFELIGPL